MSEEKCCAGCKVYSGHETHHHKDCPHYPESFSFRFDQLQAENVKLRKCLDAEWDGVAVEKILTDVEQLQAKLKALQWIPVSEGLPPSLLSVVISCDGIHWDKGHYVKDKGWFNDVSNLWTDRVMLFCYITLPELPEQEAGDDTQSL